MTEGSAVRASVCLSYAYYTIVLCDKGINGPNCLIVYHVISLVSLFYSYHKKIGYFKWRSNGIIGHTEWQTTVPLRIESVLLIDDL